MIYFKKIIKYFACVVISIIGFSLFIIIFTDKKDLSLLSFKKDIPLYLGVGWGIYQFVVNKIQEQKLNYYWMITKIAIQMSVVILASFIIMRSLSKLFI